jgi:hypothetical protein
MILVDSCQIINPRLILGSESINFTCRTRNSSNLQLGIKNRPTKYRPLLPPRNAGCNASPARRREGLATLVRFLLHTGMLDHITVNANIIPQVYTNTHGSWAFIIGLTTNSTLLCFKAYQKLQEAPSSTKIFHCHLADLQTHLCHTSTRAEQEI